VTISEGGGGVGVTMADEAVVAVVEAKPDVVTAKTVAAPVKDARLASDILRPAALAGGGCECC